jgi:hypothetical protein
MGLADLEVLEHELAAHPQACECARCVALAERLDGEGADGQGHAPSHHHIDDIDELEHAETELAWEEIKCPD